MHFTRTWISCAFALTSLLAQLVSIAQAQGSRRESGSDLDTSLNDVPVRRHMGSFYLRKQSSNPDLSHSIRSIDSIIDDDCNSIGQGESRLRIGPIRFFSRFFHDDMPRGTRSGSTSPNSFSPPSSSLHPGASFRGLNDLRRSFNMGPLPTHFVTGPTATHCPNPRASAHV